MHILYGFAGRLTYRWFVLGQRDKPQFLRPGTGQLYGQTWHTASGEFDRGRAFELEALQLQIYVIFVEYLVVQMEPLLVSLVDLVLMACPPSTIIRNSALRIG
jgi:hypothetical protein